MSSTKKRAFIYARTSKHDTKRINLQISKGKKWLESSDEYTFSGSFIDNGQPEISQRPALRRLASIIKPGELIIVKNYSRLAREDEVLVYILNRLNPKVRILSLAS